MYGHLLVYMQHVKVPRAPQHFSLSRIMDGFTRNSKCVLARVGVLAVTDPQAARRSGEPRRAQLEASENRAACERSTSGERIDIITDHACP
jgi:hypothetical protein